MLRSKILKNLFNKLVKKPIKKDVNNQKTNLIIRLLFIICLNYFIANIIIALLVPSLSSTNLEDFQILEQPSNLENKENYFKFRQKIKGRNLFNAEGKLANERKKEKKLRLDGPCPATSLSLKLLGTVVSETHAIATITQRNDTSIYRVGDQIPKQNNVSILGIKNKGIILNNNGKKECLYLIKGSKFLSQSSQNNSKTNHLSSTPGSVQTVNLESSWIDSELGANFDNILKAIYTVPEFDKKSGQIWGYKLYRIPSKSLLDKIGLKDLDIITDINGKTTKDHNIIILYESLHNDKEVNISYDRNGQKQSIKVKVL